MIDRKPVIMAVDDDPAALAIAEEHLRRRYSTDYEIICDGSCAKALEILRGLREEERAGGPRPRRPVDVGPHRRPAAVRARDIHPHAARALLIDWGAWGHRPTSDAIVGAMGRGEIDYYIPKPWRMPGRAFPQGGHGVPARVVPRTLHAPREIAVVGDPGQPRVHELRSVLARNGMPHEFHPTDSRRAGSFWRGRTAAASGRPS